MGGTRLRPESRWVPPFIVFMVLAWAIAGLAGPYGAWRYSLSLRVSGDQFMVRRSFGLQTLVFRRDDIASAGTRRKGTRLVLSIRLASGEHIEIDHWATNLPLLLAALQVESRETVHGRGTQMDGRL